MSTTTSSRWAKGARVAAIAGLAVMGAAELTAQQYGRRGGRGGGPEFQIGLNALGADAVGEFEQFVDGGWGLELNARVLDATGSFGLRLSGGFVQYGHERVELCVGTGFGCRVHGDLVTNNTISFIDLGPELGVDLGGIRPYVGIGGGLSYFATTSGFGGDHEGGFDTTNFDDLVWGWRGRAGMQARLGRRLSIDFAAVYHENGEAEYLTEGDIVDNPDGSITVFPIFSEANLVTYQLGVSFHLGGGDERPRRGRRGGHRH